MSCTEIKCFLSNNDQSNSVKRLLQTVQEEYSDKVELTLLSSEDQLYEEYNLTAAPAIVIEEMIKFVGFCPSKDTVISAILSFE